MIWAALAVLTLWLGGLTWYVVRLALAPVPVEDVAHGVLQLQAWAARRRARVGTAGTGAAAQAVADTLAAPSLRHHGRARGRGRER